MALAPATTVPASVDDLSRLTGIEILRHYGPQAYQLMAQLQGGGLIPWQRTDSDIEVTRQVQREIIAKEGDCRCGKIDCWKKELGLD
jgi:hypothetical protein